MHNKYFWKPYLLSTHLPLSLSNYSLKSSLNFHLRPSVLHSNGGIDNSGERRKEDEVEEKGEEEDDDDNVEDEDEAEVAEADVVCQIVPNFDDVLSCSQVVSFYMSFSFLRFFLLLLLTNSVILLILCFRRKICEILSNSPFLYG